MANPGVDNVSEARRGRSPLVYVLAAALVLRIVYLAQYVGLPFLYGPLFDAQVYLLQARRVAQGRFGDPSLLAFSPLYGYGLALLDARAGSILPVVVQMALGLVDIALVHRITARAFGATAAACAALVYAGYGPLLALESKIMSETLGLTLLLGALARMTSAGFVAGRAMPALQAGALAALAVLARASLLLGLPWLVLAAAFDGRARWRLAPSRAVAVGAGVLLVLGSYGAWTARHAGTFVPVILPSRTIARASQVTWDGDLAVFRDQGDPPVSAYSVVAQADARLRRMGRGEPEPVAQPFSLAGYLRQVPQKLLRTLQDRETTFDYGFYGERSELWSLRVPFVSFGMLEVMALAGMVVLTRRKRVEAPLLIPLVLLLAAVAVGVLLVTTLVHPSSRYRLPLVVALAPLAGHACATLFAAPPGRRRTLARTASGLALFGMAWWHQARPLAHPAMWELRVAEAAAEAGDVREARQRLDRALARGGGSAVVRARADYVMTLLPRRELRPRTAHERGP